ncbi:hypothetical protein TNCV_3994541 [Trichonephila clavipes]|nr:hypothetical protein TNCV_3994541 [Trichonephila clavipes]
MSFVFGECSPPAHTQEPQLLDTVPSLFDESNDLISFLYNFQTVLPIEQQEAPMDLTMPRMKKKVKNTTEFKVIKSLDLSVRNCLPYCPRVAHVYVKWLTWLDDWEMHRDEPVPWRMVGLQSWKRALEKHVQRSHERALANGMPSDVTLLEHI